jgi:hypothetical protein
VGPVGFAIKVEGTNHSVFVVLVQLLGWNSLCVESRVFVDVRHTVIVSELLLNLSTHHLEESQIANRLIVQVCLSLQLREELGNIAVAGNQDLNNFLWRG